MNNLKLEFSIIILSLLIFSCSKDNGYEPIPFYYSYTPLEENNWKEYYVTQIFITDASTDTARYYQRDVVGDAFIDDAGDESYEIKIYKKPSLNDAYALTDVWVAKKVDNTFQRVEENQKFVKLIFPVTASKRWDGNAFNNLDTWDYEYDSLHIERSYNNLIFDSTVRVSQIDNVNPFQDQRAYEIYANHIGLVYKNYINIDNGTGEKLEMTIVDYGF